MPGSQHPVFISYAAFFRSVFRQFHALDYRDIYLREGPTALYKAIDSRVISHAPQLILYTQFPSTYAYLSPQSLRELRVRSKVVAFGFDDEIYFEQSKHFYLECDALVTSDIQDAARLREAGPAIYLAQLQRPHVAQVGRTIAEDIPVSFVGDVDKPGRREFIAALEGAGIAVADYGAGTRNGPISDARVLEIFVRSSINLNFTRINPPPWVLRLDPHRAGVGQMKGRPFELAALSKFCLCEWAPCVDHWFRPGVEIGVFRDAAELVAAVKKYLSDPALRERIASAAHGRYRAEYEPRVHFERIFSDILANGRKAHPTPNVSADGVFYESVGRSRAVAFLHALRGARPLRALAELLPREWPRASFWRGFAGGLKDTVATQLSRR